MTCTIETNEIEDPVRAGGLDSLILGLAEYDDEEPDRTFRTYKPLKLSHHKVISQLGILNKIATYM